MTISGSKDIDLQIFPIKTACRQRYQKDENCVWFDLWKLGKWMLEVMKTRPLVLFHEENMIIWFRFMKNHGASLVSVWSWLLRLAGQWSTVKRCFFANGMVLGKSADGFVKTYKLANSKYFLSRMQGKKPYDPTNHGLNDMTSQTGLLINLLLWLPMKTYKLHSKSPLKTNQTDSSWLQIKNIEIIWPLEYDSKGNLLFGSTGQNL